MLVLLQAVYVGAGLMLVGHAILQVDLLRAARRAARQVVQQAPQQVPPPVASTDPAQEPPFVVVQLPVFNEPAVVVRLLDAVVAMKYPRGRWRVQVLDDSTDATTSLVAGWLAATASSRQVAVDHLCREDRKGFKAGALAAGLAAAPKADFVMVLDADFLPGEDFLRTATAVVAPELAVVQGRWAHLNVDESWVTRAQAAMLDNHFRVEQAGRLAVGAFGAFNGSGGLIRAAALRQVGGWSSASLTEDFDLSMRLQLAGWRVRYVDSLTVPAELPSDLAALRTQQHRWMRGVAQNTRTFLLAVLRSDQSWRRRAHVLGQVAETATFVALATQVVLAPVVAAAADDWASRVVAANVPMALTFAMLVPVYGYSSQQPTGPSRPVSARLGAFAQFVLLSGGLTLHNAVAVLAGWSGVAGEFERTPKAGASRARPAPSPPRLARFRLRTVVEAGLGVAVVTGCCLVLLREPGHTAYLWPVVAWAAGAGALALTAARRRVPARLIHLHQASAPDSQPH